MPARVKISDNLIVSQEGDLTPTGSAANLSDTITGKDRPPVVAGLFVYGGDIMFTVRSGVVPTATAGAPAYDGDYIELDDPDEILNFQYILAAGSPKIHYVLKTLAKG